LSETTRRILFSCFVMVILACLCLSAVALLSAVGLIVIQERQPGLNLPGVPSLSQTPTSPPAKQELSEAEIQAIMDQIQAQVSALRQLEARGDFKRALLTPEELRERVINDFLKDYTQEEASHDTRALAAFGLLEADFDLLNFLLELYSEQIAGFYDRETKEMYVVKGASFLGPERMTYAHEYTHALQDQNFDIEKGLNYSDEACEEDSERCAAIQALLEGDASLTEMSWLRANASRQERQEIFEFYQTLESPIYENAPEYMKADFLFPYEQGLTFVQTLYDQGGWEAVNQAYANVPVSTEQILHPERYPADKPIPVTLPDLSKTLGDSWEEISQGTFGEWYTYLLLCKGIDQTARLPERQARKAAEGWGGDAYTVYFNPTDNSIMLILTTTWDEAKDAREFFKAFEAYGDARFGAATARQPETITWSDGSSVSLLYWTETRTTWIMTPNMDMLNRIKSLIESQSDVP